MLTLKGIELQVMTNCLLDLHKKFMLVDMRKTDVYLAQKIIRFNERFSQKLL